MTTTAQLVDCSTGKKDRTGRAGYNPCWILRASTGETHGGYISEATARKAAEKRGLTIVEHLPEGWIEVQIRQVMATVAGMPANVVAIQRVQIEEWEARLRESERARMVPSLKTPSPKMD